MKLDTVVFNGTLEIDNGDAGKVGPNGEIVPDFSPESTQTQVSGLPNFPQTYAGGSIPAPTPDRSTLSYLPEFNGHLSFFDNMIAQYNALLFQLDANTYLSYNNFFAGLNISYGSLTSLYVSGYNALLSVLDANIAGGDYVTTLTSAPSDSTRVLATNFNALLLKLNSEASLHESDFYPNLAVKF
jgi:hypothetical protein